MTYCSSNSAMPIILGLCLTALNAAQASEPREQPSMPEISILGNADELSRTPGSAATISIESIRQFNQSDIQRILRQVPGVSIQVEDGYGLRPNLSIRGTASERSAKITLLEDGVLIAPAPYAAPSAYYFPTAGRLAGVEILKGPAAVTEGPYTIGGAVNFISTPIPDARDGLLDIQGGSDATGRLLANYGEDNGRFGWLVETHQWRSDGFQDLDNGGDTGLSKEDYTAKFRYRFGAIGGFEHQSELKLQYVTEDSEQSYLGLTDADFGASPYRRYGLSALDNIATEHKQIMLRHSMESSNLKLTVSVYNNDFERNWFKTEGLDTDGSTGAADFDRTNWFNVIQAVNTGTAIDGLNAGALNAILQGGDTAEGAIELRANAREYYSRGIEIDASWSATFGAVDHSFSAGIRRHRDQESRLQRFSTYTQRNGALELSDLGLLGNAGNRDQNADVWAVWLRDEIDFGRLQVSPGLRYEMIDQDRTRWETRAGQTADPASRTAANIRDQRKNETNVLIPGLGFTYQISDSLSAYGGVHKGFSAPSNAPGVREEDSRNFELGTRYESAGTFVDIGLFLTDYDNLVGSCTSSSGVDCEVGDAFNGDAATVAGLEMSLSHVFFSGSSLRVPVRMSYTYIDAEFDSDIADTEFFGDVQAGDSLPYIPENQLYAMVGLEADRWGAYLSGNYVDSSCVRATCGPFETVDSSLIFDTSAYYQLNESVQLTATIENLADDADVVGRAPYGARPNKERSALVGVRIDF